MTILNFIGLAVVRAATQYNYNAEWSVLPGYEFIKKLTDEDAEAFIRKQKALILFFYSRTCPHCAKVKPHFAEAGQELAKLGNSVQLAAIEFGLFPATATKYGIKKVPAIYIFRNGKLIEEYKGPKSTTEFVAYALKLKA